MNFEKVVDILAESSQTAIKLEQGDFIGEDGLLYCGKCKTPKQCIIEYCGKIQTPRCLCKCEAERRNLEEEIQREKAFKELIEQRRREGLQEERMRRWTFENDDLSSEKITEIMRKYVNNFPQMQKNGKGLILYGDVGVGKTYFACEIANALIDKGYSVYVTNFARILNDLQGTYERQGYIDRLNSFELLIIDDLGIERETAYAKEQVFNVIDARYKDGRPMIFTTNMSLDKIKKAYDISEKRIYDRILERCFPVAIIGKNRRYRIINEDYNEMCGILGV